MYRWVLTLSLVAFAVPAEALRCGNDLITHGDRTSEVRALCGEPGQIERRSEWRTRGIVDRRSGAYLETTEVVDIVEWTYDFGPGRLVRQLRFENGRLVGEDSLGYGNRRRSIR